MSTKSVDNFVHRLHKKRKNGLTKRVQTVCTNFDQKILALKIKVLKKTRWKQCLSKTARSLRSDPERVGDYSHEKGCPPCQCTA
jgi:hypothetical protein